ncbi:MAG: hypothetical protein AAF620_18000 [Bacteroidota bacterium]
MGNAVGAALRKGSGVVLDFFGDARSAIKNGVSVDPKAVSGFRGTIAEFAEQFGGTVDKIVANGPQTEFLNEASQLLESGGSLIINATKGNKFGKLPPAERLKELGFRVVQQAGELLDEFKGTTFRRTNGSVIPTESVRSTVLEKL